MAQAAAVKTKPAPAPAVKQAPVFKWSGKTRQGEVRSGEMEAQDAAAVRGAAAADGHRAHQGASKKPKEFHLSLPGVGGRDDEGHPRLHPAVLGDDRRRPPARAGPRHPRHAGGQPGLQEGAARGEGAGRGGLDLRRRARRAPEGLRRAVRAARPRRRDRRHPRHDPAAARRVHREEREAGAAREGRDGLPGGRPRRRDRRRRRPARLRHADVREDVQGHRRRAAGADAVPHRHLARLPQHLVLVRRRPGRARSSPSSSRPARRKGQELWHAFLLKTPLFGPLIRKIAVARFTRTLGTMLSSGVPILDALEIVAKTAGNRIIEKAILYVRAKISEGKNIAGAARRDEGLPADGRADDRRRRGDRRDGRRCSSKIADFYDDEVDVAVAALTSMLEPLMMVFLGGMVGGLHDRDVPADLQPRRRTSSRPGGRPRRDARSAARPADRPASRPRRRAPPASSSG